MKLSNRFLNCWHPVGWKARYSKRDVSCWTGCYKPAFMIVRKEKMQMNHVFVDLHYDLDEASFVSGSPVSSKPDHVIELYPDSFVGVTR